MNVCTAFVLMFPIASVVGPDSSADGRICVDYSTDWKAFTGFGYDQFNGDAHVVYFSLDTRGDCRGDLIISTSGEFYVFINNRFIFHGRNNTGRWNADSLQSVNNLPIWIAVYQPAGIEDLTTAIVAGGSSVTAADDGLRAGNTFMHFCILVSILLSIVFAALIRTNPRLTGDYLNFFKIFSPQEREENLVATRMTSGSNVFFYLFTAMLTAFVLMVVLHAAAENTFLANAFSIQTLAGSFYHLFILTLLVLAVFGCKLLIVYLVSLLFDLKDVSPVQFFNYVRLFLFAFGLSALLGMLFFALNGSGKSFFSYLLVGVAILFCGYVAAIFFKLLVKSRFRIFHLFSYLCASEIIPLIVLLKVYFL